MTSIPTDLALFLMSFSCASLNFFVKTIRFNVETAEIIFNTVKTFSGLSIKIVFNDAEKAHRVILASNLLNRLAYFGLLYE